MKQIFTSLFISLSIFGFTSCGNQKEELKPQEYTPSESTLKVLSNIKENGMEHIADSLLFPQITTSLLYQGSNLAGKDFAKHTIAVLDYVSADTYHELSVQNLKNGNYAEAFEYCSKAVEMDPKENAGYFGWVLLYYYRDYPNALKYLHLFDSFTPNFSDFPSGENIHYLKGIAHMEMKQLDSAMIEFNWYVKEEIDADAADFIDEAVYIHQGQIYEELKENSKAIDAYKKALVRNDHCVEAFYFLSRAQFMDKQFSESLKNVEMAKKLYLEDKKARDVYMELFHEVYLEDITDLKEEILHALRE